MRPVIELYGTYPVKLDDKGRIFLPARARNLFAAGVVLTSDPEQCIDLFSPQQFNKYVKRTRKKQASEGLSKRDFNRFLMSSVRTREPDKQGRLAIPQALREEAGLVRDAVIIGMDEHMELWDVGRWQTYRSKKQDAFWAHQDGPL